LFENHLFYKLNYYLTLKYPQKTEITSLHLAMKLLLTPKNGLKKTKFNFHYIDSLSYCWDFFKKNDYLFSNNYSFEFNF